MEEDSPEQSTEQLRVRRRLVQSTLFPRKRSPEDGGEREEEEREEEDDIQRECCGSQGNEKKAKKKRGRKPRAASASASAKKVAANSKEILNGRVHDNDSSPIAQPNFLLEAYEGQHPQEEQRCIGSQEEKSGVCTPSDSTPDLKSPRKLKRVVSSTPKKRQSTPRKNTRNGSIKEGSSEQISECTLNGNAQVPDLRLEAKMKAEENARMFSGRKIHPFFSSCKVAKKIQETIDVDSWCPVEKENRSSSCGPIHVFENVEDDYGLLDWGNYLFSERSFTDTDCDLKCVCSAVSEGSSGSLQLDNFFNPIADRESLLQNEAIHPDQNQEDHKVETADCLCPNPDNSMRNSDAEWEDRFLYERMMMYYQGREGHPENSLWTNKFVPEKAIEVCGNRASVKFLSEWLHLWHEKGFRSGKDFTSGEEVLLRGDDCNYYGSDYDSDNGDEDNGLKNVLLVTGPVGSGKSAAIYACAKEHGFHVIEVNASDWRTRTLVMQKFAGSVESYWVQRTVEAPMGSESKRIQTTKMGITKNTAVQESDSEVTEVISLLDEGDLQDNTETPGKLFFEGNKVAADGSGSKPLILFEDVDAILSEDHGLIPTIQKLAETAKRPMILTSNSSNLVLPNNMDRHELSFTKPSVKELFSHAVKVCSAEKVNIQPRLLERFIGCCQVDIRKTIMHLQFWCQSWKSRKDRKRRRKCDPFFYDTDSMHRILPKIIPIGYPSELSKMVEKEITKSLLNEESLKLMEVVEEVEQDDNEMWDPPNMRTPESGNAKAKKEAILRRHFPVQNGNEFSTPCKFSNTSESPIAFTRRNVRRKLDTVMYSDSEDEGALDDFNPITGDNCFENNDNDEISFQVDSEAPSYCAATELFSGSVSEQFAVSKDEKNEKNFNPLFDPLLEGTCKSLDISCTPELSSVPETEINGEIFPTSEINDSIIPTSNKSIQIAQPVDFTNISISGFERSPQKVKIFGVEIETAHVEEVGDSHNEHVEAVDRGYQAMDECSRMDFNRRPEIKEQPRILEVASSVEETWRRIRDRHLDLRRCVTPEERDASCIMRLAYEMSNLISETDMLLADCQPLICDSLEASMVPSEKSHSFSWYDNHLSMTFTTAQRGICFYTKEISAVRLGSSSVSTTDLSWEVLSSSTNTMALGNLVSQDRRIDESSEIEPSRTVFSLKSETDPGLYSVIQSIVPSRSYLGIKSSALYEYVSALGQISRSETSRLSESIEKTKQRRCRVARNYSSTGAMMLSPEDISLLGQYSCYRKD